MVGFQTIAGSDEKAQDLPQEKAEGQDGARGYARHMLCSAPASNIRTVSPEELIWRIRMKHNPEQTKKVLAVWAR